LLLIPQGLSYAMEPDSPWRTPAAGAMLKLMMFATLVYALALASEASA